MAGAERLRNCTARRPRLAGCPCAGDLL